jgi:hypothetical protein
MSKQEDYSVEEWDLIAGGPVVAGMTIVVADPAFFGAMKESAAIAQAIVRQVRHQRSNLSSPSLPRAAAGRNTRRQIYQKTGVQKAR